MERRSTSKASWLLAILCLLILAGGLPAMVSCGEDDGARGGNLDDDDDTGDDDLGDDDFGDDDTGDDDLGDDDAGDDDDEPDPAGDLYQSGCFEDEEVPPGWTEGITLTWDGTDLAVERYSSCRNCGFLLDVLYNAGAWAIEVVEYNDPDDEAAVCNCLFDFTYTLEAIPPGSYTFVLLNNDFGQGCQPVFEGDIELSGPTPVRYEFAVEHEGACI